MPERTNHRAIIALLLGLWLSVGLLQAEAGDRAIGVAPGGQPGNVSITGEYWAVLIGIDEYAHAPDLESAVRDVRAVRAVLETRYGFHPSRIKQLLNAQATRKNIENTLYALSREAGPEDSVFIYYAGHGQYDQARDHGWWVPTDGEPRQAGTLITNANILRYVKGMQARHVYLVADSCFSGSLFGTRALPPITDRWYAELYKDRSRWGLTSGATEPVADRGLGGHSPFAYFLLKLLRENTQPYLVPSTIHESLAPLVANNTNQVPRSEPLTQTGDEGGQFVFRLTDLPSTSPAPPVVALAPYQQLQQQTEYQMELEKAWSIVKKFVTTPGFTTEQRLQALKQFEQDFPTANPHMKEARALSFNLALQQVMAKEKAAAQAQTEKPSDENAASSIRAYFIDGQWVQAKNSAAADKASTVGYPEGRRFRDCPKCPEMMVVPTGSYEMGSPSKREEAGRKPNERPAHQVTLEHPFAVGVYEVTRAEFGRFVEATRYSTGTDCVTYEEGKIERRSGRYWGNPGFRQSEQDPVVCVSWEDAQAYVQWLSKETGRAYRLLSEAEWEYVARAGTRTARYWGEGYWAEGFRAWGHCTHANGADASSDLPKYETADCDDGYTRTSAVGVYGANAFGLHDVLGNVSEWVQDCWHASYHDAPSDGRVWESGDCSKRVIRGGSWLSPPYEIRSAARSGIYNIRANMVGFRLARTLF